MSLFSASKKRVEELSNKFYSFLPVPTLVDPVFLLGCGRSGKSTLARLLSSHEEVLYLDEPRYLWFSVFPESDIWTPKARSRHGRVALTEREFTPLKGKRLSRLFKRQLIKSGRRIVIEELAINNFRLKLIMKIFPGARFVHVYRNGLEVADLIKQSADHGGWFGAGLYKWERLVDYAVTRPQTCDLPALCGTYREKGLLEWRLSTEAVVLFLNGLPNSAYIEINSNRLIRDPLGVASEVFHFLGINADEALVTAGRNKTKPLPWNSRADMLSEKDQLLGGNLLPWSLTDELGLVQHCDELGQ